MSIKKRFLKTRPVCKVTFRLSKEDARRARAVFLVGEFNGWNPEATPMKSLKKGGFTATLDLDVGRNYQFRYLIDRMAWINDPQADTYIRSEYGNCDNSLICL